MRVLTQLRPYDEYQLDFGTFFMILLVVFGILSYLLGPDEDPNAPVRAAPQNNVLLLWDSSGAAAQQQRRRLGRLGLLRLQMRQIDAAVILSQHLRCRGDQEQEPATARGGGGAGVEPAAAHQVRLRSVRSDTPLIRLRFCNSTARTVCVIWMDTAGNEVVRRARSSVLRPGGLFEWRSHCTHAWIVRDMVTGERMMVAEERQAHIVHALDADEIFHITEPPPMKWTVLTHRHFPAPHRAAVAALLLSHHRLQNPQRVPAGDAVLHVAPPPGLRVYTPPTAPGMAEPSWRDGAIERRRVAAEVEARAAATGLERLPGALVYSIIELMAPATCPLQDVGAHPHGHDDIMPALLDAATVAVTVTHLA